MVSCESLQLSMDRKLAPFDTEEDFWEHVTNAQGKRKSNAGMSRIPSAIPGSPTAHANVAGAPGIRAEEVAAGTHRHGGQARASEGLLVGGVVVAWRVKDEDMGSVKIRRIFRRGLGIVAIF